MSGSPHIVPTFSPDLRECRSVRTYRYQIRARLGHFLNRSLTGRAFRTFKNEVEGPAVDVIKCRQPKKHNIHNLQLNLNWEVSFRFFVTRSSHLIRGIIIITKCLWHEYTNICWIGPGRKNRTLKIQARARAAHTSNQPMYFHPSLYG